MNPNSIIRFLLVPTTLSEESEKKEGLVEALFGCQCVFAAKLAENLVNLGD